MFSIIVVVFISFHAELLSSPDFPIRHVVVLFIYIILTFYIYPITKYTTENELKSDRG
jgi:hypothetical protein